MARELLQIVNSFDYAVLLRLNHLGHDSSNFTRLMVAIYDDSLKLGLFVALLWWAWFEGGDSTHLEEVREKIVAGVIGGVLSVVVVRLMVLLLPFRARPLDDPKLGLTFPVTTQSWGNWSSFPSDHAALFFLLTVCLFSISLPLGLVALFDTVFLICFPRVFVGIHYPTDIIAGAAMGIALGYWVTRKQARSTLSRYALRWKDVHPASFYAASFLFSFALAHVFFPVTELAIHVLNLAARLI